MVRTCREKDSRGCMSWHGMLASILKTIRCVMWFYFSFLEMSDGVRPQMFY